jgi:hypothetical protein
MPALRGIPVVLALLAISLSACGTSSSGHGAPWQRGYQAGREARQDYRHDKAVKAASYHKLRVYCAETAYVDIQTMKSSLLQWTEGFDAGCRNHHRHQLTLACQGG